MQSMATAGEQCCGNLRNECLTASQAGNHLLAVKSNPATLVPVGWCKSVPLRADSARSLSELGFSDSEGSDSSPALHKKSPTEMGVLAGWGASLPELGLSDSSSSEEIQAADGTAMVPAIEGLSDASDCDVDSHVQEKKEGARLHKTRQNLAGLQEFSRTRSIQIPPIGNGGGLMSYETSSVSSSAGPCWVAERPT